MLYHRIITTDNHTTTVVLIHGFLSDSTYWRSVVPQLSEQYRVITIDLLGFGASPKPRDATYSLADHTTAVAETLTAVIDRPAVIIGHSMGCLVAAQLSIDHPQLVSRLALFNMPIFSHSEQAREVLMETSYLYRLMLYSPLARVGWPIVKTLLRSRLRLGPPDAFSRHHTYESRHRSLTNTIEATDVIALLQQIPCPTVIVEGVYDRAVYRDNLDRAHLSPQITVLWTDTGHHTILQNHDVLHAVITTVLERN